MGLQFPIDWFGGFSYYLFIFLIKYLINNQ